jgi:hypothetical protein
LLGNFQRGQDCTQQVVKLDPLQARNFAEQGGALAKVQVAQYHRADPWFCFMYSLGSLLPLRLILKFI